MRHRRALILMLRMIGCIVLIFSAIATFQRIMSLTASSNSDLPANAVFYALYFLPCVIGILTGIGGIIAGNIIKKKMDE